MEVREYEIQKGDTLASIAEKQKTSVQDLVDFHNRHCGMSQMILRERLPQQVKVLFIKSALSSKGEDAMPANEIKAGENGSQRARYRCEQFNVTKVEDRIHFHAETKKEYLYQLNRKERKAAISLEDFSFKTNPTHFEAVMEATKELEFHKENIIFSLNEDNTISNIINYDTIKSKWETFKPKLKASEFYKSIDKVNRNAANDLITGGDFEFGWYYGLCCIRYLCRKRSGSFGSYG